MGRLAWKSLEDDNGNGAGSQDSHKGTNEKETAGDACCGHGADVPLPLTNSMNRSTAVGP